MPEGCEPVIIIYGGKLVDNSDGPAEGSKIANMTDRKEGVKVIQDEPRRCVWEELIIWKKGLKKYVDQKWVGEYEYIFTEEQLQSMVDELSKIISKYSSHELSSKDTAQDLVSVLTWN